MPYASGRVFHDADSHVMEPLDWLAPYADKALFSQFTDVGANKPRIEAQVAASVARRADSAALMRAADNLIAEPKGWIAYGAFDPAERVQALDKLGFARQLVFATSSLSRFRTSKDPQVLYGGARAHNRAMADFCRSDRLIGVAFVPLDDPDLALAEAKEAHRLGCGAVWVPSTPAGAPFTPGTLTLIPSGVISPTTTSRSFFTSGQDHASCRLNTPTMAGHGHQTFMAAAKTCASRISSFFRFPRRCSLLRWSTTVFSTASQTFGAG